MTPFIISNNFQQFPLLPGMPLFPPHLIITKPPNMRMGKHQHLTQTPAKGTQTPLSTGVSHQHPSHDVMGEEWLYPEGDVTCSTYHSSQLGTIDLCRSLLFELNLSITGKENPGAAAFQFEIVRVVMLTLSWKQNFFLCQGKAWTPNDGKVPF